MLRITSYKWPIVMVVLVNILAFGLLYLFKKPSDPHILLAGLCVIALNSTAYGVIVKKELGDRYLFLIVSMLVSFGMIMIYRLDDSLGLKQISWFVLGMVVFFLSYFIFFRYRKWHQWIYLYFAVSIGLFGLTLVLGQNIKGATNWIVIGGYNFQPSELIKILFVLFVASYYKHPEKLGFLRFSFKGNVLHIPCKYVFMACVYAYLGFLVLQKEWGIALLLFLVYTTFLYVFQEGRDLLLLNSAFAFLGALGGFFFVHHIKVRVDIWLDPWTDISGKGYQIAQSLFAIAEGKFFGTGIGLGNPGFIPEVHTDFIFSAICEEMGMFGGVAVVLFYFILAYRGIKIALALRDRFKKALALGITVMFGFQTFIILGGVIKLIPLTGITLPFVSYGGSSLTTSFIALGILHAVSSKSLDEEEEVSLDEDK